MKVKLIKTDILIFSVLLIICAGIWFTITGDGTIDIQLHDSYFVLDRTFLIGVVLGPIGFLIFLLRAIIRRFRNISTNIFLAIELVIVALITYYIIQVQHDYVNELLTIEIIDESIRQQVVDSARDGIILSWVIFSMLCVAFLLLIFRTARIWRAEHPRA